MAVRTTPVVHKEKKKMTSRQLQALRTKDNIYESALKIIDESGFKNTSIEAITTAAGVSTGSFYTYFTSKEHILLQTYIKSETLYQQAFEQAKHLPFPESLYLFVRSAYSGLEKRGREIMYGVMANILSDDFKKLANDRDRALFKYMRKLIELGIQSEMLSAEISASDYVDKLFMMLTGVEIQWCLSEFNCSLPALAEDSIRSLINGLSAETGGGGTP